MPWTASLPHKTKNYAERSSASAATHTCRGDIRPVPPPGLEPRSRWAARSPSPASVSGRCSSPAAIAPVAVQNRFRVLEQSDAALVDECARTGIAFMPFFALGGGHSPLDNGDLLDVAERHGAAPFQMTIAWGLARSPSIVQIPGTASLSHLRRGGARRPYRSEAAEQ
ncbi:aldo/keto reductase [Streptomyces sp. NPDC059373]